jgi:hypothetical protein
MRIWLRNDDLKYVPYMQESKEMNTVQSGGELAMFQESLLLQSSTLTTVAGGILYYTTSPPIRSSKLCCFTSKLCGITLQKLSLFIFTTPSTSNFTDDKILFDVRSVLYENRLQVGELIAVSAVADVLTCSKCVKLLVGLYFNVLHKDWIKPA